MNPLRINPINYECVVKHSKLPVLLVFGGLWDYQSRRMYAQLDEVAKKFDKKLITGKVEYEYNVNAFVELGISSVPTMVIFEDGEVFEMRSGCQGGDDVLNFVYRFFGIIPPER